MSKLDNIIKTWLLGIRKEPVYRLYEIKAELDGGSFNNPTEMLLKCINNTGSLDQIIAARKTAMANMRIETFCQELGSFLGGKVTLTIDFDGSDCG